LSEFNTRTAETVMNIFIHYQMVVLQHAKTTKHRLNKRNEEAADKIPHINILYDFSSTKNS